jgi:hypothetical protein
MKNSEIKTCTTISQNPFINQAGSCTFPLFPMMTLVILKFEHFSGLSFLLPDTQKHKHKIVQERISVGATL